MPINFPDSPTTGDTHTVGDKTWTFDGTAWNLVLTGPNTDHGALLGLGDDDHTQYLLADGTRTATELTVSGDLKANNSLLWVKSLDDTVNIGKFDPGYDPGTDPDTLQVWGGTYVAGKAIIANYTGSFVHLNSDFAGGFEATGDAVIGGDLTVDTSTLHVDSTNNRVGIGTTNPSSTLEVDGLVTGDKFTSQNDIVLNNYTTLSPSSNVYLWSPPNDRDAWIYLDSAGAGAGANWGIYHRQIDAPVGAAPANSIVFVGNTVATHYMELQAGNFYHAGYGASPNTMFMRYMSTPQAYEFGGAVGSGSLSLTGLPTNTTYVLANAFVTCAAADHFTMLLRGGGAPQNLRGWVGPGGVQPSTLFGNFGGSGSDMAIVGHPGDSDGYSSYYGLWAQVTIPMNQSRTLYYSFYGKNSAGTVAWGYIQVLAYAVAS